MGGSYIKPRAGGFRKGRQNHLCTVLCRAWARCRLFPDGPSAATQAQATPVVHPLLMAHARTGGGGGAGGLGSGGSGRSSGRRSSRMGGGGGGSSHRPSALGIMTNERMIWHGHAGGGATGAPSGVEHTLMDALEVNANYAFWSPLLKLYPIQNLKLHRIGWGWGSFFLCDFGRGFREYHTTN